MYTEQRHSVDGGASISGMGEGLWDAGASSLKYVSAFHEPVSQTAKPQTARVLQLRSTQHTSHITYHTQKTERALYIHCTAGRCVPVDDAV